MRIRNPALLDCAFALVLLTGLAPRSHAQLSDWATLNLPGASNIKLETSLAVVQAGHKTTAFSCYNRRWASITTNALNPSYQLFNEFLILQDGGTFWGYSAHTGEFAPLVTLTGTASFVAPAGGQTWLAAVQDGKRVYMYFPFSGEWRTFTFNSTPTVTYRNFAAEVNDGSTIYGVSAYYEETVPLTGVQGASTAGVFGPAAMATSAGFVHGFSAYQNHWETTAVVSSPVLSTGYPNNPGCVAIQDGSTIQFYSGATGTFAVMPTTPFATVYLHRQVAIVVDGAAVYGYSGIRGTYTALPLATPPSSVTVDQYFGTVDTGFDVYGFSSIRGEFSAPLGGTGYQVTTGQNMALASFGPSPVAGYSAFRNQWEMAPPIAPAGFYVGASAIVLVDASAPALWGLSVRDTAGWVNQPAPVPDTVYMPNTPQGASGLIVAKSGQVLFAFGPRTGLWHSITMNAPLQAQSGHVAAEVFTDGINAYGFGVQTDRWSVEPFTAPLSGATVKSNTHSGYAIEGGIVHAFSAIGQTASANDYPDFYRYAPLGGILRLIISGDSNVDSYILYAAGSANIPIPPFGTLEIDPSSALVLASPSLSGNGLAHIVLQIPNNPAFSGLTLNFQTLVNGPQSYYLTNGAQVTLR